MRSTRKYGRRNRSRRTKKNRLYGGADKTEPVLDGEKLQYLFDTSPNEKLNKFTVEVRDLADNVNVKKLPNKVEFPPYIIKITDANNQSVYYFSTQDFKKTINLNFDEINNNMSSKLKDHKFTRNKTIRKRIVEKLGEGLNSAVSAAKSIVNKGPTKVSSTSTPTNPSKPSNWLRVSTPFKSPFNTHKK